MQLKIQSQQARKEDARKKIMLGGLFVKAELDHFHPHDPATLYGMLLDAKNRMQDDPLLAGKWRTLGQELMKKDTPQLRINRLEFNPKFISHILGFKTD